MKKSFRPMLDRASVKLWIVNPRATPDDSTEYFKVFSESEGTVEFRAGLSGDMFISMVNGCSLHAEFPGVLWDQLILPSGEREAIRKYFRYQVTTGTRINLMSASLFNDLSSILSINLTNLSTLKLLTINRSQYRGLLMSRFRTCAYNKLFSMCVAEGSRTMQDIVTELQRYSEFSGDMLT